MKTIFEIPLVRATNDNLKGYGSTRMYGFLGERFMSYWFQKNTKYTTMPVTFFDINQEN